MDLVKTIRAARAVATPLLAVETSDVWAAADSITEGLNGRTPVIVWDCVRGFRGSNDHGKGMVDRLWPTEDDLANTALPQIMVRDALKLQGDAASTRKDSLLGAVLILVNPQRHFTEPEVAQGLGNLREPFKKNRRTLIMLGPSFQLPAELFSDVVLLHQELPTDEKLTQVLTELHDAAGLDAPEKATAEAAVDAARGLSEFAAEQVFAMSLGPDGINLEDAWERKRAAVNQQQGLNLSLPDAAGVKFSDLKGLDGIQGLVRRVAGGKRRPREVVFIDEIEKLLSGAGGGDLSGISDDQHQVLLTAMEDNDSTGFILVGPPGTGKTAVAKALSAEFSAPMITFDTGAMKGGIVGSSEAHIRNAIRTVYGIGGDRVLYVATCNDLKALKPELLRRFKMGVWFFDLPGAPERDDIWQVYLERFGLEDRDRPQDDNWTGAEIRNACDLADQLGCSLQEASQYIVPVARSNWAGIERLRGQADGNMLSASATGTYSREKADGTDGRRAGRLDS